jgi:hypothetical protein
MEGCASCIGAAIQCIRITSGAQCSFGSVGMHAEEEEMEATVINADLELPPLSRDYTYGNSGCMTWFTADKKRRGANTVQLAICVGSFDKLRQGPFEGACSETT